MSLVKDYLDTLESWDRSVNTIESYRAQLTALFDYLRENFGLTDSEEDLPKIKGKMLNSYYLSLDNKASTKNLYVTIIKGFFRFAVASGDIVNNPADILRIVSEKRNAQTDDSKLYTPTQIERLFQCAKESKRPVRNTAILAFLLGTGLRAEEVCSVSLGDIRHMKKGIFYCKRKGGNIERIAIASSALAQVKEYIVKECRELPDDHPLFFSKPGKPMTRNTLWRTVSALQEKAGLKTGVHTLRHVVISYLAQKSAVEAQIVAGHSNLQTTQLYIHTSPELLSASVNALPWNKAN